VELARPDLVSAYDVVPTLIDFIGGPLPERNLCGRSYFLQVLNRPLPRKEPWTNLLYATLGDVEMARDARFKLVQRTSVEESNELYDMRAVPPERMNQYTNAQFITVRDSLAEGLAAWKKKYSA
jgi:arylsulfatase A-like enzyme